MSGKSLKARTNALPSFSLILRTVHSLYRFHCWLIFSVGIKHLPLLLSDISGIDVLE